MTKPLLPTATFWMLLAAGAMTAIALGDDAKEKFVGLTPQQVPWFTPSYYQDGRQRAQMLGDSSKEGGAWIDRVRIPGGLRIRAHTHPDTEIDTVIEGTWYLGLGEKFDESKLKAYPAGSFVVIPAGVAHFIATREGPVIVQISGNGRFRTDFLEK
jgi:quercetin dioxygenase-like cupin family protein